MFITATENKLEQVPEVGKSKVEKPACVTPRQGAERQTEQGSGDQTGQSHPLSGGHPCDHQPTPEVPALIHPQGQSPYDQSITSGRAHLSTLLYWALTL